MWTTVKDKIKHFWFLLKLTRTSYVYDIEYPDAGPGEMSGEHGEVKTVKQCIEKALETFARKRNVNEVVFVKTFFMPLIHLKIEYTDCDISAVDYGHEIIIYYNHKPIYRM